MDISTEISADAKRVLDAWEEFRTSLNNLHIKHREEIEELRKIVTDKKLEEILKNIQAL